ncbi:MAG: hypothetical protein OHK0046_20790 [Anaerolineae bacterium]
MPLTAEWDNEEKTVILLTFSGRWSLDELYFLLDDIIRLSDEVPHMVDHIVDVRNTRLVPESIFSIRGRLERRTPANSGDNVVVGANMLIQRIAGIFSQVVPQVGKVYFAATLEDARVIIEKIKAERNA